MLSRFASNTLVYLTYRHSPGYLDWYFHHRSRLERFRDIHKGERCFVIGNGPSLNRMDLAPLKDCLCFGLNKIYLIFERSGLEIDYHVAVNKLVIEQSHEQFASLGCPSFLSYSASKGVVNNFSGLNYILTGGPYSFSTDITGYITEGGTVTYVALQIAYYMGFSEVYLIGVDHNFSANGLPNEKQILAGKDPNHFDPDYFSGKEWQLPDLESTELSFRLAKYFYGRAGRQIYDATVGGKLAIFSKVSYEEALSRCLKQPIRGGVEKGWIGRR